MKLVTASIVVLGACVAPGEPVERELVSALTPVTGQGSDFQGSDFQGSDFQGSDFQGTQYNGTSFHGASYSGASLVNVSLSGTALVGWRSSTGKVSSTWQQRFPDRICTWNYTRTFLYGCTTVDLSTSPSPLAGSTWVATFTGPDGPVTGTIRIEAVRADTKTAMHPLKMPIGSGSSCELKPQSSLCDHPGGCRVNCDLWMYDLRLIDSTGQVLPFCPNGGQAIAVPGTYSSEGEQTDDPSRFTFACTNGTIAKCTRWGYRPFGSAMRSDNVVEQLAGYHQACIRAAAADYCASGHSFTQNGTLVDIYDYQPHQSGAAGFIPRTASLDQSATALFVRESTFDQRGATMVEFERYSELGEIQGWCPDMFELPQYGDDVHQPRWRVDDIPPAPPYVSIDRTKRCSHTERVLGQGLSPDCSACTRWIADSFGPDYAHCFSPSGAWDQMCLTAAQKCSTSQQMALHGECTVGAGLQKYDSGCTLAVCLDPAYASCCSGSGWTSACASAANAKCKGGLENGLYGFCGGLNTGPTGGQI